MVQLITRNRKHVKVSPITSEKYLRDQLARDRKAEMLKDIIRQFKSQTQHDKDLTSTDLLMPGMTHEQLT